MFDCFSHYASPPSDLKEVFQFAVKWTPRAIVAGLAGYYSLGIAYHMGIMAAIDRIAMHIFLPSLGYMGMGFFMPTFQWYSAWGVRVLAAIGAGFLYDLAEKIFRAAFNAIFSQSEESDPLSPTPMHRTSPHLFPASLS